MPAIILQREKPIEEDRRKMLIQQLDQPTWDSIQIEIDAHMLDHINDIATPPENADDQYLNRCGGAIAALSEIKMRLHALRQ